MGVHTYFETWDWTYQFWDVRLDIPILRCEIELLFLRFEKWWKLFLRFEIVIIIEMWDWHIFTFVIWEKTNVIFWDLRKPLFYFWDWFIIWYELWDWEWVLISWDKRLWVSLRFEMEIRHIPRSKSIGTRDNCLHIRYNGTLLTCTYLLN